MTLTQTRPVSYTHLDVYKRQIQAIRYQIIITSAHIFYSLFIAVFVLMHVSQKPTHTLYIETPGDRRVSDKNAMVKKVSKIYLQKKLLFDNIYIGLKRSTKEYKKKEIKNKNNELDKI